MEGNPFIVLNVLPILLAGFQLSLIGRFWVSPEGEREFPKPFAKGGVPIIAEPTPASVQAGWVDFGEHTQALSRDRRRHGV
jgi:hypothetical protein